MTKKVLLIDCCVRREQSRTLARRWLAEREPDSQVEHLRLYDLKIAPLTAEEVVQRKNTALAKQLAQADELLVAAPYWDLSFPSILKVYLEQVCVTGITFCYEGNQAVGLCRARKAIYISTAGGYVGEHHLGEEYVKALFRQVFGIPDFVSVRCEGLDLPDRDPEQLLENTIF